MHREEIKASLRMKGVTPSALADELGVSSATMSQVISGRAVSARVRSHIARVIGKPVDVIWPPVSHSLVRRSNRLDGARRS